MGNNQDKVTYAFIDSQNINFGIKSLGWELDFHKFNIYLKEKYKVDKAYLFIGQVIGNESLYTYLQEAGFILVFKPTLEFKKSKERITKGNVDAELVLHTMIHWNDFDKAIIVSGDGDFFCLAEYLFEKGKLEKIIVPNRKYSSLLRRFAGSIVHISLFRKKVEKNH